MSLRAQGGAGLVEWGYLVLVATLAQATVAGLALIVLPLLGIKRDWPPGAGLRFGGYFLLLGLAFLFVEIAFIQKFILFLSHPLYSVAVVLAGFLVFVGLPDLALVAISLGLIAPLAFLMGIPFPVGLSRVAGEAPAFVPWAWGRQRLRLGDFRGTGHVARDRIRFRRGNRRRPGPLRGGPRLSCGDGCDPVGLPNPGGCSRP